jgi:hypothetical protein
MNGQLLGQIAADLLCLQVLEDMQQLGIGHGLRRRRRVRRRRAEWLRRSHAALPPMTVGTNGWDGLGGEWTILPRPDISEKHCGALLPTDQLT